MMTHLLKINKIGILIRLKIVPVIGAKLFQKDPFLYVDQIVLLALQKTVFCIYTEARILKKVYLVICGVLTWKMQFKVKFNGKKWQKAN